MTNLPYKNAPIPDGESSKSLTPFLLMSVSDQVQLEESSEPNLLLVGTLKAISLVQQKFQVKPRPAQRTRIGSF